MGLGSGRALALSTISTLLAISLALTCVAQQAKVLAPHKPIPPRVAKPIKGLTPPMKRSMVGGLWMTDANWKSSIYLRNGVETDSITVTPILHLSNGARYVLADVAIEPAGVAIININDGLDKLGISPVATFSGYLELQYMWGWDPFCATIRNVDVAHSLIFNYALRPSDAAPILRHVLHPRPHVPAQMIEGLWWKQESNVTAFVSVANLSAEAAKTTIQLTDDVGNSIAQHQVTVSPHGMKLVDLNELQSATASRGGIRISSTATMDNVVVNGGLEDPTVGYSANLPFSGEMIQTADTPQLPTTVAELGLMTGVANPMMLFPAGTTFTPYSLLRNISNDTISFKPTVWWMEAGNPHSAQLPMISLKPWQTQSLDIKSLLSLAGLKNFNGTLNLVFYGQMKPGSLIMTSGSVDQTSNYVFEVVPRSVGESGSKSLQYWSTGNGDDTMVTVWNPADEAQDFAYTLFFSGGHYTLPLHLEPRATRSFNVSEIIQNQVPDSEGNIIPASIHEGGSKLSGSHAENEHILVAIDSGTYNVRKATCSNNCQQCDGYSSASLIDTPFGVAVGGTHQQNFTLTWNSGTQYNFNSNGTWSSSNTSMATVATGLVRGVSPGSPQVSVYVDGEPVEAGYICTGPSGCPVENFAQSSGGTVFKFAVLGNPFIFVGTDTNIVSANSFFATDGNGGSPQPPGGTVSATSSDSNDTFQITQGNNPVVKVTTQDQSTSNLDRTLTFTYTVSGNGSTSQQMNVTARKFAHLTNNSPSNQCTLGHGSKRTYIYTVYTHPDGAALDATSGLSGTPVTEPFDQTPQCLTHTGDTILDANAAFSDNITYCGNVPLTCVETRTQTLKIAGVSVRTNTLTTGSGGVTYTNNGPNQ